MPRPKKGTPEGKRATEKWRKTMQERYGDDFREMMKKNGAKGGANGHTGGFASNRTLASWAGAKGGARSRRGETVIPMYKKKHDEIAKLYRDGYSIVGIARALELSPSRLYYYVKNFVNKEV